MLCMNGNVFTQNNMGRIYGRVFSDQGIPLEGANVIIKDPQLVFFTDSMGRFQENVPANVPLQLIITYIGLIPSIDNSP